MSQKLSFKEKLGYGFGDTASSMFWKLFSMYLMFFYTDIFGISAAVVGTMFFVTRLWDALNDPLAGILADRTETRWGKFRPYLLWMAVPFGIIGVLTFTTPAFSNNGKIWYAYITYTLMMMIYTLINVPYASLMGVMTADLKERTSLATYRFVCAFGGSILVLASFQPLFDSFGTNNIGIFNGTQKTIVSIDSDISSQGKNITIFENTLTKNKTTITDSLLYFNCTLKVPTNDSFEIGVYDKSKSTYQWIHFNEASDTLGVIRDGTWCTVNLKLRNHIDSFATHNINNYSIVLASNPFSKIEIKDISIREVNYAKGTQMAVIIIAILAVLFFLLTFFWTKERIKPIIAKSNSIKTDIKDLLKNKPWFILLGSGISALLFISIRDGAAIYYFKYYIQNQTAYDFGLWGSALTFTYATLYLVLGQFASILGVLLAKPISDKIGKSRTFLFSMLISGILSLSFYWMNKNTIIMIFILQFLISIFAGIIFPLLWSMYADTADYSEWKTGRRATGLIFSSSSMSQKFGWTLGSSLAAWLLAFYGFEAGVAQSATSLHGIQLMVSIIPAFGAFLSVAFMIFYKLSDNTMITISNNLQEKRKEL